MSFENTTLLNQATAERMSSLIRDKFDQLTDIDFLIGEAEKLIYDAHCLGLNDLVSEMIDDAPYSININHLIKA